MTERRPTGMSTGDWVDQQIRDAQARGAFDNLPGMGKPLPDIDQPHDEDWWIRRKLRDEGLPADALLPPALVLRREVADLPERVAHLRAEQEVRDAVHEVDVRVASWIRLPTGPVLPVRRPDAEVIVARWRESREERGGAPDPAGPGGKPTADGDRSSSGRSGLPDGGTRRPWWRRLRRRAG